jgi:outer membrane protein assembly factor BamB
MSCVAQVKTTPPETPMTTKRGCQRPQRLAVLFGWWALLTVVTAIIWLTDIAQDYKNVSLQIALVLALCGVSIWTLRSSGLPAPKRWWAAALIWTPVWAISPLGPVKLINNGNTGVADWRWRWAPAHDETLTQTVAAPRVQLDWKETDRDYPRFLGNGYWAEAKGIELEPDWKAHQPKLLWKQPIGAGWSGFAIVGDYAVTQEQRGDQEMVVCYELKTGQVAWSHADAARWDPSGPGALGGVGPRATPTVYDGRVYTHGATGILNCIDSRTGKLLWSHDTLAEFGAQNISWGKSDSPLIVDDNVVISVGGLDNNSLVAFDRETGDVAWGAGSRRSSYASPVLTEIAGVRQILVVNENFLTAHDAATGEVLWEHPWDGDSNGNASASQPVPVGDDRILLSKGYGIQSQLIRVSRTVVGVAAEGTSGEGATWSTEIIWSKPVLRTKFGNVVIRDGVVYGIDDIDMDSADLATGKRNWKKRRRPELGHGQIMLVGDKILVISEAGELVLIAADPGKYRELAKLQAIEGVTWNNPALSGPYLLVRNAEEAACFELPLTSTPAL